MRRVNLGVIIGHRAVFPGTLAEARRREILETLHKHKVNVIVLEESATGYGAVSRYDDSRKYAALFSEQRELLDGIFVSLADFGDETSIAATLKLANLDIPVFVHAYPDNPAQLSIAHRSDAFCGKLSLCNNLRQLDVKYSIGRWHVVDPTSDIFSQELQWFLGVCRVVNGLRKARIGVIGARTPDFATVRFSEKLLERSGIVTVTVDLSDIVAEAKRLGDSDPVVDKRRDELLGYVPSLEAVPEQRMGSIARISLAVENWANSQELNAYAVQCWPSMQKTLGVFPCVFMSLMSNDLMPSACETDVLGAISMYALQLATGTPSGLFDLNNNFGDDPNRMILFHCGNCPVSLMRNVTAGYNAMAVQSEGVDGSYSTLHGALKSGPITFTRVRTDDLRGTIMSYVGTGTITDDVVETFGTVGVLHVKDLQMLLRYLSKAGFEHHVAINFGRSAEILHEAFENYMGWEVYHHASAING